jgi:signal peptidase I
VEPLSSSQADPVDLPLTADFPGSGNGGTGAEPPVTDAPKHGGRDAARVAFEWIGLVVLALLIALLIKTFLFQAFYIPSASMEPTLKIHDRVLVNKLSYKLHDVHRGDIVVFKAPKGSDPGIDNLVKRVIGLPGDTVEGRGGHVYINGKQLPETYLPKGTFTSDFAAVKVPPNSYWMMGDNRGNSKDSRVFGFITKREIVGRVFVRIWPFSRLSFM